MNPVALRQRPSRVTRGLSLLLLLSTAPVLLSQALPTGRSSSTGQAGSEDGLAAPGSFSTQTGLDGFLSSTTAYDQGASWSSILTPGVVVRFNSHLSADWTTPIFASLLATATTTQKGSKGTSTTTTSTSSQHFVPGDSALNLHGEASAKDTSVGATLTLGAPTGNSTYGLTAGKFTYGASGHLDHSFGPVTPEMELGLASSSDLVLPRVNRARARSTTGKLVNAQLGASFDLPRHLSLDLEGYEELPIGTQQIRGASANANAHGRAAAVTTGTSAAEDNGLNATLALPHTGHIASSVDYSHSIRQSDDTVSLTVTWSLHRHATEAPVR